MRARCCSTASGSGSACSLAAARLPSPSSQAIIAAILLAVVGAVALLPGDLERRLGRWASGSGRFAHLLASAVTVPALAASGVRTAIDLIRAREVGLQGAPVYWGFEICVVWAMFHAFGSPPPFTVILMAYFVRDARQPAAAPRRTRRRRGRDDRRACRVRRPPRSGGGRGALLSRDLLLGAHAPRCGGLLPAAPDGGALARGAATSSAEAARGGSSPSAGLLQGS